MCEPVSATLGTLTLLGGVAGGIAQHEAAEARADAARRNAEVADRAASHALRTGEIEVARVRMQDEALGGQQRVGYAGMGVDVTSGSAARTALDTATMTEVDVATTRRNAQLEAWGLRVQADNMRAEADDAERAGDMALAAGILGGIGQGVAATMSGLRATGNLNRTSVPPPGR
jgi:membrane protein involved in colicin uptake